jgi:hypothetical protein
LPISHVAVRQAPVQLGAGRRRVLQWYLAERDQAGVAGRDGQGQVVEDAGQLDGLGGRPVVAEEHRGGRDHLVVDAVGGHVGEADGRVPAGRVDPPELLVAEHDDGFALGFDLEPGPAGAAARDV